MPKGEEDDCFDSYDFEQRLERGEIDSGLDIELDYTIHSNCNRSTFNKNKLKLSVMESTSRGDKAYPNVSKNRGV